MKKVIAIVIAACVAAAATAAHADPYNEIMIVPPAKLPELARQGGDSLLLREARDGQKLLYVEQENGSKLATFDVTDPVRIKGEGSVQLQSPGAFDFVSPWGEHSELVRFRQDQTEAVLDFHKDKAPNLETAKGLVLPAAASVGDEAGPREPQVRKEVSNTETGTTFVLAADGLYVIRRPAVEADRKRRAQEWFEQHNGG